jgi:lipoyl-dependent peroxiredoxin
MPVLYTAAINSTGGRVGHVKSSDGKLDLVVRKPAEMQGDGEGTNPEQLFAAAYAACYGGAIKFVAEKQGIEMPTDFSIDAQISINLEGANMFLSGNLVVNLPGMDTDRAEKLANTAYNACMYTKAIKGNVEVGLTVVC